MMPIAQIHLLKYNQFLFFVILIATEHNKRQSGSMGSYRKKKTPNESFINKEKT